MVRLDAACASFVLASALSGAALGADPPAPVVASPATALRDAGATLIAVGGTGLIVGLALTFQRRECVTGDGCTGPSYSPLVPFLLDTVGSAVLVLGLPLLAAGLERLDAAAQHGPGRGLALRLRVGVGVLGLDGQF
ncbi:MAG: hypothetical protein HY908_37745 [Myxococcales bacterium]|nr:hypothetical protein [Myxococcales bacterium]